MDKHITKNIPDALKKAWKLQDIERALELTFRDYSYHLQHGMSKETQKKFFSEIIKAIDELD